MGRLIDCDKLCEDLLERWHVADKNKENQIIQLMADVVTPIIASQPTVDVAQEKHGHWIDRGYLGNDNRDYMCSVCGAGETHTPRVEVRYCWNCGARMDEECDNDNAE